MAGAAVAWWAFTRRDTEPDEQAGVDAETQTDIPKRHDVDVAVEQAGVDDNICYNVMYTAALYTTNTLYVCLETRTRASMTHWVYLWEWHKLKGRYTKMLRALEKLDAPESVFDLYEAHRAHVLSDQFHSPR